MKRIIVAVVILMIIIGVGVGYGLHRHNIAKEAELATHPTGGLLLDETTEAPKPTKAVGEVNIKLHPDTPSEAETEPEIIMKDEDGNVYRSAVPESLPKESENIKTGDNGNLIEQAQKNQEAIESSQAVEQSGTEKQDSEEVTDKMHQDFQNEINDFNQKQYEKMMEEAKQFEGGGK